MRETRESETLQRKGIIYPIDDRFDPDTCGGGVGSGRAGRAGRCACTRKAHMKILLPSIHLIEPLIIFGFQMDVSPLWISDGFFSSRRLTLV